MATQSVRSPFAVFYDLDGSALQNGFVYVGIANQNPETSPAAIFWDSALTQPAPQPLRTMNGAISRTGTVANVFISGDFSITVRDKKGNLIYSILSIATSGLIAGFAASGANSDITSLLGLTTALSSAQGGSQDFWCGSATGTPNAIIATAAIPATGFNLAAGVKVKVLITADNSSATTLNANTSGIKAVQIAGSTGLIACVGAELKAGMIAEFEYTGTVWQLLNPDIQSSNLSFGNVVAFNNVTNMNSSTTFKEQTLTVTAGSAAWDMSLGPNAFVNLNVATTTLANPTNQILNQQGIIRFLVDATGGRLLTFGTSYNVVSDAFWSGANRETEYFYKVVAASGVNSIELRAKTRAFVQYPSVATTSGTSVDFTNIPAWAKRITISPLGISTNGTSSIFMQLGAGSITTVGYLGASSLIIGGTTSVNNLSSAFLFNGSASDVAAAIRHGSVTFTLISGNSWVASGGIGWSNSNTLCTIEGSIALSGTLDRVRLTTANGTDIFDAGSVSILVEG